MKIYTRGGDSGDTSLFGGARVSKDDTRVVAYGTVDELNSFIGLAIASLPSEMEDWRERLTAIQSDCFVVGAILATPKTGEKKPAHIPELDEGRVEELESWIDGLQDEVGPLEAFVLPGGTRAAAALHVARGVCRRAERYVVTLARSADVQPVIIKYLNRLSDFLFTIARVANSRTGADDVEWHP